MRISFAERLKKLQSLQTSQEMVKMYCPRKRTSIEPYEPSKPRPLALHVMKQFQIYTTQILPKMEEDIEIHLLKQQFRHFKNEEIKQEIMMSYLKRKAKHLFKVQKAEDYLELHDKEMELGSLPYQTGDYITKQNIYDQDRDSVGQWTQFSQLDLAKYFTQGFFGNFLNEVYSQTKKFDLMCTEEGLKTVYCLRMIDQNLKNPFNYFQMIQRLQQNYEVTLDVQQQQIQQNINLDNILQNEQEYFGLFQSIASTMLGVLSQPNFRGDRLIDRYLRVHSNTFDLIIRIYIFSITKNIDLLKIIENEQQRKDVFENILLQIQSNITDKTSNFGLDQEFIKYMQKLDIIIGNKKIAEIQLKQKDLEKYNQLPQKIVEECNEDFIGFNSGIMLHGDEGTGKSGTLAYITMWAHKANWIVVSVPNVYTWNRSLKIITNRHYETGLYVQNDQALIWLKHFKFANEDVLQGFEFNLEIFGKCNWSGVHQDDNKAVENTYDERRKVYFEDYDKENLDEDDEMFIYQDNKEKEKPFTSFHQPKTILELIDHGISDPWFATVVVAEVLEQLKHQKKQCVLETVDDYNYMFYPTTNPSYRYVNQRSLQGAIPPYHMALSRLFLKFSGHTWHNGFKAVASTNRKIIRTKFNPNSINFPPGYDVKMTGLLLDDYKNMFDYYLDNQYYQMDTLGKFSHEFYWVASQGNWKDSNYYTTMHYRDVM